MVSRLSGVYLLSFCLIGLNAESMPNLCSITSLGIPSKSDMSCEDIHIFLEKSDEREFLFGLKLRAETKLLISVIRVYRYFLISAPLLLVIHRLIGDGLV
jgi:hypothetical protein